MKLFEPFEIKGMKLKNRLGFAPLLNMPREEDWGVGDKTVKWFEERAKGGVGFIMTGSIIPVVAMAPDAKERFAKLADAVHKYDTKIGVQITGMGGAFIGTGPSKSPFPNAENPKEDSFSIMNVPMMPIEAMTIEQIKEQVDHFAIAAGVLKEAGIDCVEVHCAHGGATLLCSFISPFYNRREDEYGGSWENRLRFPSEVIGKMRETVGEDYPILVRFDADELLGEAGITLKDATEHIAPALEKAGADCLDVSQGSITHSPEGIEIPMYYSRGCYIHHAEAVKKATKLPVIGVGRIVEIEMAEKFLQEGKADLIYMGRQLTADPETPNKFIEGRSDEIRVCVACSEGCGTPCPINYDISPDAVPLTPAEKPKKIVIVGGGVGGMEAARVCTLRGHKVTVMEKRGQLGGVVSALALTPLSTEFGNLVDYLTTQMSKLEIDVRVCKEASLPAVKELDPDVVIVATGSSLVIPEETKGVIGVMDHITALREKGRIGKRVVIWGLVATDLAISLANEGKEVVLFGRGDEQTLNKHCSRARRWYAFRKLTDVNVVRGTAEAQKTSNLETLFHTNVEGFDKESIVLANKEGVKRTVPFDTLIISRESVPNDSLYDQLKDAAPEVYKIGDCATPGSIEKAIFSANEVARKI
ncbi:MAG: FAD-dependent oxidoreductase [Proteobacteria bacterium]|nr:FAD-dependent oxidoreductase [Pseudomonadota bacterium]